MSQEQVPSLQVPCDEQPLGQVRAGQVTSSTSPVTTSENFCELPWMSSPSTITRYMPPVALEMVTCSQLLASSLTGLPLLVRLLPNKSLLLGSCTKRFRSCISVRWLPTGAGGSVQTRDARKTREDGRLGARKQKCLVCWSSTTSRSCTLSLKGVEGPK